MSRRPVKTKHDFVRRYKRGEFGNASPTWNNISEVKRDPRANTLNPSGRWHIRNRIAGGPTWYNVSTHDLDTMWVQACGKVGPENLYISCMAPHDRGTLQGEICRSDRFYDLTYTLIKKPMREALAEMSIFQSGIGAIGIVRHYMDDPSYLALNELFDEYPGHTIEFSCFEIPWGTIPNRNTVFWEVRAY